MSPYAELRAKTCFTFLRGASQPGEMVERARELELAALAVTDLASMAGVVRAHGAAKEAGLPLLIGAEVEPGDVAAASVVLLAQHRSGYGNLCRLLTMGRRRAPKGECLLFVDDLLRSAPGLIAVAVPKTDGSGDAAELPAALRKLRDGFGDRLYASMEAHGAYDDVPRCCAIAEAAQAASVPLIVTNDAHTHVRARQRLQDVMVAIRERTTVAAAGRHRFPNAEHTLRGAQEQRAIFRRILGVRGEEAVERTVEVAARCAFSLGELRYEYPDEIVPEGETPASWLRKITEVGARERYPRGVPKKVKLQIEHELALLADLRYEPYFLTVYDAVAFARSRGILCQGRGSAANSAVCYCIGITSVDPARSELLFERFVSKERNEPPDIDVDFEHERREEVIQYIYQKYGRDRAGIAAEVICYRGRSAVREVGKALGLSLDQVDGLAKTVDRYHGLSPEAPSEGDPRAPYREGGGLDARTLREAGLDPQDRVVSLVAELACEIEDFPRHLSQHVGGFVMSRGPLCELVPIENAAMEGRTVVQWDKDDLEALGLLKVDILALGILTATRKCFDLIAEHYTSPRLDDGLHGEPYGRPAIASETADRSAGGEAAGAVPAGAADKLTLATLPAEDPETYEMLCHADAVGVFQVESRAQRSMLPRLRPRRFYDLVVEVAIVRPGPIQGGMVHPYLRRRAGEEAYDVDEFPALREVLERTHGVPLFQEQVMRIAVIGAGFSPGEADRLRRAMGAWKKRGVLEGFYKKFIGGMRERGYPLEFAERVFEQIRGFGEYGFPESHAASFALLAYATSYLKRRYPCAFTAALINSQPMGFYAPAQLVGDAREHGVEVRPVDVNASDWDCTLEARAFLTNLTTGSSAWRRGRPAQDGALPQHWGEPGPALRLGMRLVRDLPQDAGRRVAAARVEGGPFRSIEECARRASLGKRALEALVAADAFASLGLERRTALWEALGVAERPPLFESVESDFVSPELAPAPEQEQVVRDYESTGLSLRQHPMAFLREALERAGVRAASELEALPHGTEVRVAGIVLTRQRPQTASGVVFVSLEDETGASNLILPARVFERDRAVARNATGLVADGTLERQGEVVHVKVRRLWDLPELARLAGASRDFH